MKHKIQSIFAICAFLVWPEIKFGQEARPVIDESSSHYFFSSILSEPEADRNVYGAYFEVCNNSKTTSSFYWEGAAFGVDAFRPLEPNFCVRKETRHDYGDFEFGNSNVTFQDGISDAIDHILPCNSQSARVAYQRPKCKEDKDNILFNFFMNLRIFGRTADGRPFSYQSSEVRVRRAFLDDNSVGAAIELRNTSGANQSGLVFRLPNVTAEQANDLLESDEVAIFLPLKSFLERYGISLKSIELEENSLVLASRGAFNPRAGNNTAVLKCKRLDLI